MLSGPNGFQHINNGLETNFLLNFRPRSPIGLCRIWVGLLLLAKRTLFHLMGPYVVIFLTRIL